MTTTKALETMSHPTLADLDALPPGVVGEIIEGVLYTRAKPRMRHQRTATGIGGDLRNPFDLGRGGPGGWWIVTEPGIELPNTPELAPDVAGWRRERMPEMPVDEPIRIVPDWVARSCHRPRGAMTCSSSCRTTPGSAWLTIGWSIWMDAR
jgi:hypothetical protein